jgi:hypothetical protein
MNLIAVVLTLIIVGVLLGLLHLLAPRIHLDATILLVIDIVVLLCVVIWLLNVFGVLTYLGNVKMPKAG